MPHFPLLQFKASCLQKLLLKADLSAKTGGLEKKLLHTWVACFHFQFQSGRKWILWAHFEWHHSSIHFHAGKKKQ